MATGRLDKGETDSWTGLFRVGLGWLAYSLFHMCAIKSVPHGNMDVLEVYGLLLKLKGHTTRFQESIERRIVIRI